ncbi:MAG: hypothetical protein ACI4AQ_03655 [Lachnospiraceae bacterium]
MRKRVIMLAMSAVLLLSGCASVIELSSEEEDMIAEYAAQAFIKSYKKNLGLEETTESPSGEESSGNRGNGSGIGLPSIGYRVPQNSNQETTSDTTETVAGNEESTAAVEETTKEELPVVTLPSDEGTAAGGSESASGDTLEQVLGITGVEVSVIGYAVESRYPLEAYSLTVDAPSGHKLLIVEYDVWNSVDVDAVMGVDPSKASVKAVINGTERVNVYKTMLKNDLLNMNGTKFAPGEAKTGVLIFSIEDELAEKITSVDVLATLR